MNKIKLSAQKREVLGRKVKRLREKGYLPANVYGKDIKSTALKIDVKEFLDIYEEAGETKVIRLKINNGKEKPVLISHLQKDSLSDNLIHVEFRQIDLKEKVQASVPIELIGEPPAVNKGGVLVQMMDEVEIEALPEELPEKLEISVSELEEIDQSISLNDLPIDKDKMTIMADDLERLIVKIEEPTEEEVEEVEEPEITLEEGLEEKIEGEEAEGEEKEQGKETEQAEKTPEK